MHRKDTVRDPEMGISSEGNLTLAVSRAREQSFSLLFTTKGCDVAWKVTLSPGQAVLVCMEINKRG